MKNNIKIKKLNRLHIATLVLLDEFRYIRNKWLLPDYRTILSEESSVKRASLIYKKRSKNNIQLYEIEVEWLFEYWTKQFFNEGKMEFILQRLQYFGSFLGKERARPLFYKIQNELHQSHVRENEPDEVKYPEGYGYDEWMADNMKEYIFNNSDLENNR